MQLALNLLGPFEAHQSNSQVPLEFPRKKAIALLAILATPTGKARSREELCNLVWGNFADKQARDSLRQTLFVIRKIVPDIVGPSAKGDTLTLNADHTYTDIGEFEATAASSSPTDLERAYKLYSGEFIQGFSLREDQFERWLSAERRRLENLALSVMERLLVHYRSVPRTSASIQVANRALDIDPLHEEFHRILIECYAAEGRMGQAHAQYEKCRSLLAKDLGIRPSTATEHAYATLLGSKTVSQVPESRTFDAPAVISNFHSAPAVAVLPFECSCGAPPELAGAFTPNLIAVLAAALPSKIIDYRSVSIAAANKTTTVELAGSFGARYAAEGSIRSWNNRWRAEFSLVDVLTGRHLCTGSSENADADLFQRVAVLASQIGVKIALQIEAAERTNATVCNAGSVDAWQSFNRGMALLDSGRHTDVDPARLAFLQALDTEPFNARAISGLARSHIKAGMHLTSDRIAAFENAYELARKAHSLAPTIPYVNLTLGLSSQWTERFELAGASLQRAHDAMPHHPDYCLAMGNLLGKIGSPDKAITLLLQAPDFSTENACILSRCYLQLGEYHEALGYAERAVQLSPLGTWPRFLKASALGHLDQPEKGFETLLESEALRPGRVSGEFRVRPTQYKDPREQDHIHAGVIKAGWQP